MTDQKLASLLNEVEARELPLLSWGVTTGSYSEDELLGLLERIDPSEDPESLLEALIDAGLLIERGLSGDRFRTRMSETVRLASNLRQWFHGRDWRTAPNLVSDLRFMSRPRVVPIRDISADDLALKISRQLQEIWTPRHEASMRSILEGRQASRFQAQATERILSAVGHRGGTCITAGTGAGKTLAFYLPALMHILANPTQSRVPRIVAIYPRIELLRDQLRAILQILQRLDTANAPAVPVGVLYGATPRNREDPNITKYRGWRSTPDGLVCPIVSCLEDQCRGDYVWLHSDRSDHSLRCVRCKSELDSLIFTRQALESRTPEILFTTTEMANQQMGSSPMRRLLVGDERRSPDFLLLDEIHTYSGTHGAQVANLLRRWRSEMASPSHVVGLSATLADPIGFFSQLIGAESGQVSLVSPAATEMQETGREYFMALRGDPASQTSLLSTTIQTSMLLRRMLDSNPESPSAGAFGSRLFVFTDKLDIVNRLYNQLQDAEGWLPGGVNRKPRGSLAILRGRGEDDLDRDDHGQLWDAAEYLGTLHRAVEIERTTSQDAGVRSDSDVVVATASLEVGFDDPNVGAVLQHKAPRDAAQFLQRRGRAGRDPNMRPWTTVVLSDYGRDRLAFQAYEALFDPQVRPSHLPIRNRAILKMQATWWLLDYLDDATGAKSVRSLLSSRWNSRYRDHQRSLAGRVLETTKSLLTDTGMGTLHTGLKRSLRINDEDVRAILWDHPRALAATVLPTIIRRLEVVVSENQVPSSFRWNDPISDFVPRSLFAPLQTPEVQIMLPSARQYDPEPNVAPIAQTMREFAPGRVNYRFALRGKRERTWVKPPDSGVPQLQLEEFCPDYLDLERPPDLDLRLVQPRVIQLSRPRPSVSDSAYGRWNWEVAFHHDGEPLKLDMPSGSPWSDHILSLQVMSHRNRAPLTVWRFARTMEVERHDPAEPPLTHHGITLDGQDAAVGFAMSVDGLLVDILLPDESPTGDGSTLENALRVAYFEHLVMNDPLLGEKISSSFLRDWLSQLALCAMVMSATCGTNTQSRTMSDQELRATMVQATRSVFGATAIIEDDSNTDNQDPRLVSEVETVLRDGDVISAIKECLGILDGPLPSECLTWMHERFSATLAAALIEAIQTICPDVDIEDLRPDIEIRTTDDGQGFSRITISEDQPGGTGVIEAAVDRIIEDPRSFWAVVTSILGPCDGERIDLNLRRFLQERSNGHIQEVEPTRAASTLGETTSSWERLRGSLFLRGIDADQTVVSALATRLLRPGSDIRVEDLCRELLEKWDRIEDQLRIEVELRVFAYVAATDNAIKGKLRAITASHNQSVDWEVGQLVGLLWPRGGKLRSSSLQSYNPYRELPRTERLLFQHIADAPTPRVRHQLGEWRDELDAYLRKKGSATISCPNEHAVADAIRDLLMRPTAIGVLEFHPRVVGLTRSGTEINLLVDIREAQQ